MYELTAAARTGRILFDLFRYRVRRGGFVGISVHLRLPDVERHSIYNVCSASGGAAAFATLA
jgi:hypothetical protein